ncbi:MAG TPA: GNAT family protein [Acidimicrobiia bacterium]|nr:GNAT family protein [Acidimicrobiia bacterium]
MGLEVPDLHDEVIHLRPPARRDIDAITRECQDPEDWVAAGARRQGIATRAVRLAARWAALDLGIARVELLTRLDNTASQGVAARSGFTREGVLCAYTTLGCGLADVVMFSLLPGRPRRRTGRAEGICARLSR